MLKWLIALAKCRQITRQMPSSYGMDAVLDVPLFVLKPFDRSIQMDGVFKMDDDYLSSMGEANQSLLSSDFISITNRYRTSLFTTRS
jgi:hypothetical protein